MPLGELMQINPDGTTVGPGEAILEGCGRWTTVDQNPMQRGDVLLGLRRQELAMTIGYGVLFVGGLIVVRDPADNTGGRYELQPACTDIILGKPAEL